VAQIGACKGCVFHHRPLAAVTGSGGEAERALQQLEKSELVYRRGIPARGDLHVQTCAGAGYRLSEPVKSRAMHAGRRQRWSRSSRDRRGRA
jgi:hypothetical protein